VRRTFTKIRADGRVTHLRDALDVLAWAATGRIEHDYNEKCPDEHDHDARDPDCLVCMALMYWDQWHWPVD